MATGQLGSVFRQIGRLFGPGTVSGLTEAQLLARFVERRDEAAFEALVSRFGPMVLGVCRQVLADPHAADDAFQATFLVLVKRARSIRERDLLGNWLYGVALKVAKRARADQSKRRAREQEGQPVAAEPIGNGRALDDIDLGPILHEELAGLPEKYRAPMVLCYLDGQTCEEAAGRLGWPVGTVKGRLSRAKDLLRQRLARRGVTASAAILAATLTKAAEASVPPFLLDQTVRAAMVFAAGGSLAAAGLGSAAAVALAEGVHTTMILTKWKTLALAATLVGTLAGSAAVMARQLGGAGQEKTTRKADVTKGVPNPPLNGAVEPPRVDAAEAPIANGGGWSLDVLIMAEFLPEDKASEADLAAARVSAAKQRLESQFAFYENGTITIDRLLDASERYMNARVQAAGEDRAAAIKAVEDHVRIAHLTYTREKAKFKVGQSSQPNVSEAELNYIEARIALAKVRSGKAKPAPVAKGVKLKGQPAGEQEIGAIGAPVAAKVDEHGIGQPAESDDADGDKKIMAELAKPISMPFANETPLEDVIKYVRTATTSPVFVQGLPFYVEPEGLAAVDKTLDTPIKINLEGIKLKTTLRLVLKQLGLGYYVKHGLVMITNLDDDEYKDAMQPGWRAIEARERAKAEAMGGMGPDGIHAGGGGGMR